VRILQRALEQANRRRPSNIWKKPRQKKVKNLTKKKYVLTFYQYSLLCKLLVYSHLVRPSMETGTGKRGYYIVGAMGRHCDIYLSGGRVRIQIKKRAYHI